jgi:hypothetical protein
MQYIIDNRKEYRCCAKVKFISRMRCVVILPPLIPASVVIIISFFNSLKMFSAVRFHWWASRARSSILMRLSAKCWRLEQRGPSKLDTGIGWHYYRRCIKCRSISKLTRSKV